MGCIIQLEGVISHVHSCLYKVTRDMMGELTK